MFKYLLDVNVGGNFVVQDVFICDGYFERFEGEIEGQISEHKKNKCHIISYVKMTNHFFEEAYTIYFSENIRNLLNNGNSHREMGSGFFMGDSNSRLVEPLAENFDFHIHKCKIGELDLKNAVIVKHDDDSIAGKKNHELVEVERHEACVGDTVVIDQKDGKAIRNITKVHFNGDFLIVDEAIEDNTVSLDCEIDKWEVYRLVHIYSDDKEEVSKLRGHYRKMKVSKT